MTLEKTVAKYRALFKSKPAVVTAHEPKGHFYVSPTSQEKYHSVTYFTSFIKDPSLSNWKMNRALEHVRQAFTIPLPQNIDGLIKAAKLAPEETFHNAGDIGSQTHAWRQQFFQAWIESGQIQMTDAEIDAIPLPKYIMGEGGAPTVAQVDPEVISGCRAIKRFLKETGYIPVACELALVDDELKVGGTIDDLGVFPNSIKVPIQDNDNPEGWTYGGYKTKYFPYLGFVDLKTSNQGKKPAYAYQVRGFYQRMIRKTFGIKPKKTYILHTSKDDGTYKLIDLTEMKHLEKDAKDLVRLSRSWDKVGAAFKPKVLTI